MSDSLILTHYENTQTNQVMEKFISQVPFSLETKRATKQSPRLHQPELLTEWSEFYPEDIDPPPPEQNKKTRAWWQRGQYQ